MNIVITAGGTSEKIDNVRKITNSSTGKLGVLIANELINKKLNEINKIFYVCSSRALRPNNEKIEIIEAESTSDLEKVVTHLLTNNKIDYFIHLMAVSDYTTNYVTNAKLLSEEVKKNGNNIEKIIKENANILNDTKISSYEDNLIVVLKPTPKIISIIKKISPKTFLVGFKLLDGVTKERLIDVAKKLRDKNDCDLVVANDLSSIRKGKHIAYIIDKQDNEITCFNKENIAKKLIEKI